MILLSAALKPLFSQDSLKSYVMFRAKHVIAYLDGKKITPSHDIIYMKKGMHHIKAWAPTYQLLEDSFMVVKNKTLYSKRLRHTNGYRLFVAKRWLRGASTVVLPTITVFYLLEANYQVDAKFLTLNRNSNDELSTRERINYAPGNLIYMNEYLAARLGYVKAYASYERAKTDRIIGVSALAAASLAYIIFTGTCKLKFKEKPLLSRITPGIDPLNNRVCIRLQL